MSIETLKAKRDAIEKAGIGVYLPVMKEIFAAIDEHINDPSVATEPVTLTPAAPVVDAAEHDAQITALEDKVTALQNEVAKLTAENTTLASVAKEAISEEKATPAEAKIETTEVASATEVAAVVAKPVVKAAK